MKTVMNTSNSITQDVLNGNSQVVMMHANIRPSQGLNINMDVLDSAYVAEHREEIAGAFEEFLHAALLRAKTDGLPVLVAEPEATEEQKE